MSTTIETMYSAGLDALANLFEVLMTTEKVSAFFTTDTEPELTFRIQDFEVPASEAGTYSVHYGPWEFDKPNGKVNPNRTITLNVRIDKNFELYQSFTNWKNAIQNEYTGVLNNVNNYTETLQVFPIRATGTDTYVAETVGQGAVFERCWVSSVGAISFDQSSGEPLIVPITFNYLRVNKDFNKTLGSSAALEPDDD